MEIYEIFEEGRAYMDGVSGWTWIVLIPQVLDEHMEDEIERRERENTKGGREALCIYIYVVASIVFYIHAREHPNH